MRLFVPLFLFLTVAAVPGASAAQDNLTVVPVQIDPLGATEPVPWKVHVTDLNVRTRPTTTLSSVLGTLPQGALVTGSYYLVVETDQEWIQILYQEQVGWISRIGVTRIHPTNASLIQQHGNLPYSREIVNRWWGIPIEYEPDDLVVLPQRYGASSSRTYRMRAEAAQAMMDMIDAAAAEGIRFYVSSPYRSGAEQKRIYDGNVSSNPAQRFSAPPGHSEHQLGSTSDIARPGGGFLDNGDPQHTWLLQNGHRFGYRQTYRADNLEETGYIEEPWHWRYMGVEFLQATPEAWVLF